MLTTPEAPEGDRRAMVAQRIRERRLSMQLTKSEAARRAHIADATWSRAEGGTANFRDVTLAKIASALKIDFNDLLELPSSTHLDEAEMLGTPGLLNATADVIALWDSCSRSLRDQVSDATWMACFASVTAIALDDKDLVLTTPSTLVRDKLERRYRAMIEAVVKDVAHEPLGVRLLVRPPDYTRHKDGHGDQHPDRGTIRVSPIATDRSDLDQSREVLLRTDLTRTTGRGENRINTRCTFDNFVVGMSNRFAHAAAQRVAESPGSDYNPLFIYGGAGLGKTHLLHAIGNYVLQSQPRQHVRYVSTETFMNELVDSIRNNTGLQFKRRYRACDVLLVDDIQFIENKESLQEEFFHTFNSLHEENKQIVLTSDRHPRYISTLEDRLRSRFASGVITDIQPPELETRVAILRRKAEEKQQYIPDDVLELIATRVRDDIRQLEGAWIRVSAYASLGQEPLTMALAQRVLSDVLTGDQLRPITPKMILESTASMFGFTIDELVGTSRRRPLVIARQISMYVFSQLTDFSYPAIAQEFGGRDHTTVIRAIAKISELMTQRREVYDHTTQLIRLVRGDD